FMGEFPSPAISGITAISTARACRLDAKPGEAFRAPTRTAALQETSRLPLARLARFRHLALHTSLLDCIMSLPAVSSRGRNLALLAELLGWMFDGMEMGLFPLVGRDALRDLLPTGTDKD